VNDPIAAVSADGDRAFASDAEALRALHRAEAVEPVPDPETIRPHLPEKGMTVGLHRLLARSLEAAGLDAEAEQILLALAERLNQEGLWAAVAHVAALILDGNPPRAVPLIARARAQGGPDAVDDPLLFRAHERHPGHGLLAWQAAEALAARNETGRARRTAAAALPELIEEKNYETAEMALLLLSESEESLPVAPITRSLELLARQEAWDQMTGILELVGEHLAAPAGAETAWPVFREVWRRHPEQDDLRTWAIRLVRGYLERYPDPGAMLRIAEVERPSQSPDVVLARLERLERFPPGYYARHTGWGIGRIRDNDTETLVIDFPAKPAHRMTMATAGQALDRLEPGNLEVLLVHDREGLEALLRDDPAAVVALALRCLPGGDGTGDAIRKLLVPRLLTAAAWTAWWKTTRGLLMEDARVDTRNAFRNVFRIPGGDAPQDAPIPVWDPGKDVLKNLAVLDGYAAQHPGTEGRLAEAFAPGLRERLETAAAPPADRVAIRLWLSRMDPGHAAPLDDAVDSGFDINVLAKREQEQLLAALTRPQSLRFALESRLIGIRRAAWRRIAEHGAGPLTVRPLLETPARNPEAALFLLEMEPEEAETGLESAEGTRTLLLAVLDLLERPPRDAHRRRALALLAPDRPLARRVAAHPLDDEGGADIVRRLQNWESSDRFRFPVLDLLRSTGHAALAEVVEGARARQVARISERLDAQPDDPYAGTHLLTRPTLKRLETERHRVGMELKTSIPRMIQKAREHGDLKENAEYDAAKAKQAAYAKRFEELDALVRNARLIEELPPEPGVVRPGTAVDLEPVDGGSEPRSFWILGEGDQDLGDGIVSYRAPLGQALTGLRENDEVSLPQDGGSVRYRIRRIEERLP
jgi:transcription elongation factor GreA